MLPRSAPPSKSPLSDIELRLRYLLPASLYASVWVDPSPDSLMQVFQHLRTMQHILQDYTPHQLSDDPPRPGQIRYSWQEGTLLFNDLAGFTPLMEASAASGRQGAVELLKLLNRYFSEMIEIVSKSGGDLLEFTGDAILVQFLASKQNGDTAQAVRAGLRMQRAMAHFQDIKTPQGSFSLDMRVGIHAGRFLAADIGTPERMVHVLLGQAVQRAKRAESNGRVGRVCITLAAGDRLQSQFQLEPIDVNHQLVIDNLGTAGLGEYDITVPRRRSATSVLFDRSVPGLLDQIGGAITRIEPLACFMPAPILNLLVESAAQRQLEPDFPVPTIVFINLVGLPESVDVATASEVEGLVARFSQTFALIHAVVRSQGGILQKVTYHSLGSDMLLYFGALGSHPTDRVRAAETALAIRKIVAQVPAPIIGGQEIGVSCRIGMAQGAVFAGEIGEPRGRREFNILGDPVNTAARLMSHAAPNQILLSEDVQQAIAPHFQCRAIGDLTLKGKAAPMAVFELV